MTIALSGPRAEASGSRTRLRGEKPPVPLRAQRPTLTLVHTPMHTMNEVEICFSIVQRKVVTPNDLTSLHELDDR